MCCTENQIQMDHSNCWGTIGIVILSHNPHAHHLIRLIRNICEPLNQCTQVENTHINKRKECEYLHDVEASYSGQSGVALNRQTVM